MRVVQTVSGLAVAVALDVYKPDVSLLSEGAGSVSVNKIVNMLTEIQGQVNLEKHVIETQFKKFECWADSFNGEFAELMERAQAQQAEAEATIQEKAGSIATGTEKIKSTKNDIEQTEADIESNRATHTQKREDDHSQNEEYAETIEALDSALVVLNGRPEEALVQSTVSKVQRVLQAHHMSLGKMAPKLALLTAPQGPPVYERQSGQIVGVLNEMLDSFTEDKKQLEEDMEQEQQDHDSLIKEYQGVLAANHKSLEQYEIRLADDEAAKAQAEVALQEAKETMNISGAQLDDIKDKIRITREEHGERMGVIANEQKQLGEAISMMTKPEFEEALDAAGVGKAQTFLQMGSSRVRSVRVKRAVKSLKDEAKRSGNFAFLSLANSIKDISDLSGLESVTVAIDGMVEDLKSDIKNEQEFYDRGVESINTQDLTIANQKTENEKIQGEIDLKNAELSELAKLIEVQVETIKEQEGSRDKGLELFTKEDESIKKEIAADKKAIDFLAQVKNVLAKAFSSGKMVGNTAFVQIRRVSQNPVKTVVETEAVDSEKSTQGIKAKMDNIGDFEFGTRTAAADVPSLIQKIIDDASNDIAVAQQTAQNNEAEWTETAQTFKESIRESENIRNSAEQEHAVGDTKLQTLEDEFKSGTQNHMNMEEKLNDLHSEYDFIIKWREQRAENKQDEIDALNGAKAFLNGMNV